MRLLAADGWKLLAVLLLLFQLGCSNSHYLVGDSWLGLMAPFFETHTGCDTLDLTSDSRRAIDVLLEDLPVLQAEIAALPADSEPFVFLSAGVLDEAVFGPYTAGLVLNDLVSRILEIRSNVVVYHLDYTGAGEIQFWNFTNHESEPRWHRVTFEETTPFGHEISPDGLHLYTGGYVERLLFLLKRYPHLACTWGV